MKKVLVVNGEKYWQDLLPGYEVVQKFIQNSSWVFKNDKLFVTDAQGVCQPEAILWRVGAIKPSEIQTTALNLIDLANIPCINSPQTLKTGFDRLSMLLIMKKLKLPVIDFSVVTKSTLLKNIKTTFPFVVKVGNYHGGFGKVLVEDEKKWQDIQDLLFITDDYITVEPFIHYRHDIRYITIQNKVWAMTRKGKFWKANIGTVTYQEISPKEEIIQMLQKLQKEIEADILAIDILEEENGQFYIVEYNDIPGLSGFNDELKYELADIIRKKLE